MARDATATRDKLIRAGERLFARKGVDGALTRDIVAEARQSNGSAVQYHFGSRQGLLAAISDKHVARMEPAREKHLERLLETGQPSDVHAVLTGIVTPTADLLTTEDGRDFLRIMAQLAGYAGVRSSTSPAPLVGTALRRQLVMLEDRCRGRMPEPLARERIATVIGLLTAALADRARQLQYGERPLLDHDDFVANLIAMMAGALLAPA